MSALTNLSDYLAQRTGGLADDLWFQRNGTVGNVAITTAIAGYEQSLWVCDGIPCLGVTPTTAAVPTNATIGTMQQADPGGGRQKWLTCLEALVTVNSVSTTATGILNLYDRLLHIGGLSATNTGAQTVQSSGSPALTRYTDGLGNEIWVEINTQIGATPTTITASYTNESGATHTTQAVTFGGTNYREKTRIIKLPLAAGDKGVQAIASVTVLATTGTAGDFGVVIAHPLAQIEIVNAGISVMRSFMHGQPGPIEIVTGAALALSWLARSTNTVNVTGCLHTVEK